MCCFTCTAHFQTAPLQVYLSTEHATNFLKYTITASACNSQFIIINMGQCQHHRKKRIMGSEKHNGISQCPERDWHLLTNASTIFHNNKSMAVMVTLFTIAKVTLFKPCEAPQATLWFSKNK